MQETMNQFRLVWQSDLSVKAKTEKMNALVWNKGRWSLPLFSLLPALRQKIDAAQARYLRRILKLDSPPPTSVGSRIKKYAVAAVFTVFPILSFAPSSDGWAIFSANQQRTHSAGSCLNPTPRSTLAARLP